MKSLYVCNVEFIIDAIFVIKEWMYVHPLKK